jgi:predicted RNase H-like nuclease (RuvC/YqgF family)
MAIWGRLKQELDRASRVAQSTIDEGRVRLEVFRARQRADRAAQTLGYAMHRARNEGRELSTEDYERYASEIRSAEAEIERLETQLSELRRRTPADSAPTAQPPATI